MNNEWRFKYSSALCGLMLIPASIVIGIYALSHTDPSQGDSQYLFISLFVCFFTALQLFAYRYYKKFSICVNDAGIMVCGIYGNKVIPFDIVRTVSLTSAGRGVRVLTLKDKNGKKLFQISGSVVNFDNLVRIVRDNAIRFGAVYK